MTSLANAETPAVHVVVAADELEVDTSMLAAVHAALNPERRAWKHDILSAIVLTILGMHGRQPLARLHASVQRTWATGSVSVEDVQRALDVAGEAGLVETTVNLLSQKTDYGLTDAAQAEVRNDSEWASRVIEDFTEEMMERVQELVDAPVRDERRDRLAGALIGAIANAARGTYGIAEGALSLNHVRPCGFDTAAMSSHIHEKVVPPAVADAVAEIALAVMDEDDEFGNELLRLLVVGNMLQGLVGGRDLAAIDLGSLRVLLDTNVLLSLYLDDEGGLSQSVDRAVQAGVSVEVADHILDEWESLWQWADNEVSRSTRKGVGIGIAAYLVENPFIRAWISAGEAAGEGERVESWPAFSARLRDIRSDLERRGVRVRPHGNTKEYEKFQESVTTELLKLTDPQGKRRRTAAAARADGCSAAMIARWRDQVVTDPPRAWLITRGRATLGVYRALRPGDAHSLAMTPAAWSLYLSCLHHDDDLETNSLVEQLSRQVVRDAYLSVATQFSLSDVEEMAELLTEAGNPTITRADLHRTVQLQIEDLGAGEGTPRDLWLASQRRRSARRDARAVRERAKAARATADAKAQVAAAEQRGRTAAEADLAPQLADAKSRAAEAADMLADTKRFYRRLGVTTLVGLVLAGLLIYAFVQGSLGGWWLVAGGCLVIFYATQGIDYVRNRERSVGMLLLSLVAAVAIGGVELAAGQAIAAETEVDEVDSDSGSDGP